MKFCLALVLWVGLFLTNKSVFAQDNKDPVSVAKNCLEGVLLNNYEGVAKFFIAEQRQKLIKIKQSSDSYYFLNQLSSKSNPQFPDDPADKLSDNYDKFIQSGLAGYVYLEVSKEEIASDGKTATVQFDIIVNGKSFEKFRVKLVMEKGSWYATEYFEFENLHEQIIAKFFLELTFQQKYAYWVGKTFSNPAMKGAVGNFQRARALAPYIQRLGYYDRDFYKERFLTSGSLVGSFLPQKVAGFPITYHNPISMYVDFDTWNMGYRMNNSKEEFTFYVDWPRLEELCAGDYSKTTWAVHKHFMDKTKVFAYKVYCPEGKELGKMEKPYDKEEWFFSSIGERGRSDAEFIPQAYSLVGKNFRILWYDDKQNVAAADGAGRTPSSSPILKSVKTKADFFAAAIYYYYAPDRSRDDD